MGLSSYDRGIRFLGWILYFTFLSKCTDFQENKLTLEKYLYEKAYLQRCFGLEGKGPCNQNEWWLR